MLPIARCRGLSSGCEHAVASLADRVHHAVAADGDDARDLLERDRRRPTQLAGRVRLHRLHDVPAEVPVLGPAGLDGRADVGAPDDLVGVALDVVALEEVLAAAVPREVEDAPAEWP